MKNFRKGDRKMAEKKNKSKKVLAASVILAAMIVAGSSFAWFTSTDEVVNKLSATNTYAVTVTENFTPPPQWLPGQTVEKQAGAINTGNIDAFVKLTLSNQLVLTTYDEPATTFNSDNVDTYVTLDAGEVKSLQAGGWLVYNAGTLETDNRKGTDFTPATDGLYIFERVTEYAGDGSVSKVEYAGYYFNGDKYYALAEITHTAATETDAESFSATIQTVAAPVTVIPTLTYDAGNNMVVATYGEGEKQIKINIHLADNHTTNWTNAENTTEFYYNKILAADKETGNLVTSVELDKDVTNAAYIAMDYNLKITAESVQVTNDDDKTTAVNAQDNWHKQAAVSGTTVTWADKT